MRLTQKEFKVLPKDILSYLAREPGDMPNSARERKQKIICVDVSNNKLTTLPSKFFESFSLQRRQEMECLKAAHNMLKTVSDKIEILKKLTTLKLPNNYLDSLPPLPVSLQHLNLAHNQFTSVPVEVLSDLGHLQTLDLSFNKIELFAGLPRLIMPKLEELYLQGNQLKELPFIFSDIGALKLLGLDWFEYLCQPFTRPKVVEDVSVIQ